MSNRLTLKDLALSPNNVKVRIALGYKGLEYEREPLEFNELDKFPGDRSPVVQLSRQPRLPVLQDGQTVLFGSDAILRYLEANFPDTPPIFVDDYQAFGEIEQWEIFARTQIGEPMGMIFGQAFATKADSEVVGKANRLINDRTGTLEDKLNTGEFLVGDHLTAADIACASPLYLADLTEKNAASHPIAGFFQAHLKLGEGREKTRAWVRRVMAYDPVMGQR
ncbi:MAG: glutathione S-transferase family protein [Acidobacteria bacterium]|nr:MAG: glutathione S-transferase family protein [Acidobacteriota bacterium]